MTEYKKGQKLHIDVIATVKEVFSGGSCEVSLDGQQTQWYVHFTAIDAIATPIVEEPTGQWAVVRDKHGTLWRKVLRSIYWTSGPGSMELWSAIEDPTVLFEGVEE